MKSVRVVMVAAVAALSFAGGASAGVVMTSTGGKVENPLACGYVLPRTKTTSYTFEAWLNVLNTAAFYPTAKAEWNDVKTGVISVQQKALTGGDVAELLDALQATLVG